MRRSAILEQTNGRPGVVPRALGLIDTMEVLSTGWADGLLGFTVFCWAVAVVTMMNFADSQTNLSRRATGYAADGNGESASNFVFVGIMTAIPFMMANDIAHTCSCCDQLMDTINDVGIRRGENCYARVAWLESRLKQLHNSQGLGFKVAGTVLDQRFLKGAAVALGSGLTTLISTLLALSETSAGAAVGANITSCALSAQEATSIRAARRRPRRSSRPWPRATPRAPTTSP